MKCHILLIQFGFYHPPLTQPFCNFRQAYLKASNTDEIMVLLFEIRPRNLIEAGLID